VEVVERGKEKAGRGYGLRRKLNCKYFMEKALGLM
jgi:hypothetical protein